MNRRDLIVLALPVTMVAIAPGIVGSIGIIIAHGRP
jgi:hypothetical protein